VTRAFRQRRTGAKPEATVDPVVLQATQPPRPVAATTPEVVLGHSNLLPFEFLRAGDRIGRAVVKIVRADGASGTGFLVAPDVLLTNHHVLPTAAVAAGARAMANYEPRPPGDPSGREAVVALAPEAIFVTEPGLDFTFCGVHGLEHLGAVPLDRNSFSVLADEYVNIVQHPRGRYKEVALQDNQVVYLDGVVVRYSCDTEPGSSGSPVFNNQWGLVALHHASVALDGVETGPSVPGEAGPLRYLNEGVRLSAIALWLDRQATPGGPETGHLDRLRAIFRGCDPHSGFFGGLGRRSVGRDAASEVVECHARTDTLDLAYWDLGLPPTAWDQVDALAWSITELGFDVWVLRGMDAAAGARLREHLVQRFRLEVATSTCRPAGAAGAPVTVLSVVSSGWEVLPVGGESVASAAEPWSAVVQRSGRPSQRLGLHLGDLGGPPRWAANPGWPFHGSTPLAPVDPRPWLLALGGAGVARSTPRGDALLLGRDAPVMPDALAALSEVGWIPRCTGLGPACGMALVSGAGSCVERVVFGPELVPVFQDAGEPVMATDPERGLASGLSGVRAPTALRLVLGPVASDAVPRRPETARSDSAPPTSAARPHDEVDPRLEQALSTWLVPRLAWFLTQLSRERGGG
jgi:hypothetical protein